MYTSISENWSDFVLKKIVLFLMSHWENLVEQNQRVSPLVYSVKINTFLQILKNMTAPPIVQDAIVCEV